VAERVIALFFWRPQEKKKKEKGKEGLRLVGSYSLRVGEERKRKKKVPRRLKI